MPLFREQMLCKVRVIVTDLGRYIMTLSEAVDPVMYTFEHAETEDLFVQKSPAADLGASHETLL